MPEYYLTFIDDKLDSEHRLWDESTVEIFTTVAPIANSPDGRMGREAQSKKLLCEARAQSSTRSLFLSEPCDRGGALTRAIVPAANQNRQTLVRGRSLSTRLVFFDREQVGD